MTRGIFLFLALLAGAARVDAQTTQPAPADAQPSGLVFMPRFDSHVSIEHFSGDDRRFVWDGDIGVDFDVVDYGRGRAAIVANYEVVMGDEFRPFDPNQGNYTLAASASARAGAFEFAGVFHHVSRHLSDRPKRTSVDWDMVGGRISRDVVRGRTELRGRADIRGVIRNGFVDYRWEVDTDVAASVALRPRISAIARGGVHVRGVDGSRDRGTQYGYRGEGGVRFRGRAAAFDLFVATERRIDPYQLEFSTVTWVTTGFRISGLGPSRVR